MMKHGIRRVLVVLASLSIAGSAAAQATFFGPSSYLSSADSPLVGMTSVFYLEDCEDGVLNQPGVSASSGFVIGPSGKTDSVDGDDGTIDGSGTAGHSYNQGSTGGGSLQLTFTFDAAVLGGYPTVAGLVWTDDKADVSLEAFDPSNASLGVLGPYTLGDDDGNGGTSEDRFFGVVHAGGIGSITMYHVGNGMEVDHLQFGLDPAPVPVMAPVAVGGLGVLLLVIGVVLMKRRGEALRI
jgi:hypothetical protein